MDRANNEMRMRGLKQWMVFGAPLLIGALLFWAGNTVFAGEVPAAIPVPGCVVVQLDSPEAWPADASTPQGLKTGDAALDTWLSGIGATSLRREYPTLLPEYRTLRFDPAVATSKVVDMLRTRPEVLNAWGNTAFPMSEWTYTPNDPNLPSQWHHENIHSTRAWALSMGDTSVVVGIIDSGVDYMHPDLMNVMWVNAGEDLNGDGLWTELDVDSVDNDSNGYVDDGIGWDWVNVSAGEVFNGEDPGPPDNDPIDFQGHGTHCAGDAAAATDNQIGVASPGAGCRVAALRAGWANPSGLGVVGLSEATSAIDYAFAQGFSVVSMSFGGAGGDPLFFSQAMQAASSGGMLLVAAAGNEATTTRSYPAAEPYVIAVAATSQSNHLAGFSNRGDWVAISAPGVFIQSTMRGGGIGAMSGTSMACPIVAGAMAQLRALAPDWETWRYQDRLVVTASPMSDAGSGAGLLNFGALLDPFVSIDSVAAESPSGPYLVHDSPCTLHLNFSKYDGFASGVYALLSSSNDRVSLGLDSLWIGSLAEGSFQMVDVPITIANGGDAREEFVLDVSIQGTDQLSTPFSFDQQLHLPVGASDILLVDADEGGTGTIDTWYTNSLQEIGKTVDVRRLDDIADLAGILGGYQYAILATGSRESSPFREGDLAAWEGFLANGGKWLATGQNIAESMADTDSTTLADLFHVNFTAPHANRLVARGLEGHFAEGMSYTLAGNGGAWNQNSVDVLEALPGADPVMAYTLDVPEELAAVRVSAGPGDLVYCAFGVEGINDDLATSNTRAEFFSALFDAWENDAVSPGDDVDQGPRDFRLDTLWPNPTNRTVTLSFTLPQASPVKVRVVNRVGREVASWVEQGRAGAQRISWQMPDHLASGVYLVSVQAHGASATRRVVLVK